MKKVNIKKVHEKCFAVSPRSFLSTHFNSSRANEIFSVPENDHPICCDIYVHISHPVGSGKSERDWEK